MIQKTCHSLLLLMLGCFSSSWLNAQTLASPPKFDPYLPGELNERALYALQVNDVETALILLERAYVLNPNVPDIKANLGIVRNIAKQNMPVEVRGAVSAPSNEESVIISGADAGRIPALWPEVKP